MAGWLVGWLAQRRTYMMTYGQMEGPTREIYTWLVYNEREIRERRKRKTDKAERGT